MYESKETRSTFDASTLSDKELVHDIVANGKNSRLVDELWRRIHPVLANVAKNISFKKDYDLTEDDALNEAYVAAWDILPLYDGSKGASLNTYLRTKLRFHFKDLKKDNSAYEERNEPYDEKYVEEEDGKPSCGANYGKICKVVSERYDQKYREIDVADAYLKVRSLVTVPRQQKCLDLLKEAFVLGEKNAVPYVAERLGCSRQQVYNILNRVQAQIPDKLAKEVRGLF
jgi:RNA polymerase sigma factor (sigma-70 family)